MNIFVTKLNSRTTGEDLENTFSTYGAVKSAEVTKDRETGYSRGFGFVEMPNDDEALVAIEQLNNSDLHGSQLVVKQALPKEEMGSRSSFNRSSSDSYDRNRSGGGGYRNSGGGSGGGRY